MDVRRSLRLSRKMIWRRLVKNVQPAAEGAWKREDTGQTSNAYKELLMDRLATGEYLESGIILDDVCWGKGVVEAGGRKSLQF
jgi:hypothetical protein